MAYLDSFGEALHRLIQGFDPLRDASHALALELRVTWSSSEQPGWSLSRSEASSSENTATSKTPEVSESCTKAYLVPLPEVRSFLDHRAGERLWREEYLRATESAQRLQNHPRQSCDAGRHLDPVQQYKDLL